MNCSSLGGLTLLVLLFCAFVVGGMLIDAYGPQHSVGAAEIERPAPTVVDPGHPAYEGITAVIGLFVGGYFLWKFFGGNNDPHDNL
jgi:hypothetical protein